MPETSKSTTSRQKQNNSDRYLEHGNREKEIRRSKEREIKRDLGPQQSDASSNNNSSVKAPKPQRRYSSPLKKIGEQFTFDHATERDNSTPKKTKSPHSKERRKSYHTSRTGGSSRCLDHNNNRHEARRKERPTREVVRVDLPTTSNFHSDVEMLRSSRGDGKSSKMSRQLRNNLLSDPVAEMETVQDGELDSAGLVRRLQLGTPEWQSNDWDGDLDEDIFGGCNEDKHNESLPSKPRQASMPVGQSGTSVSSRRISGRDSFSDTDNSDPVILNMFFKEVNKIDKLTDYFPHGDEPCLERSEHNMS
jgi:hypothetical protein